MTRNKLGMVLMAALVLAFAPALLSDYNLTLLGRFMALAITALGISLIWGQTGILSLGQGLFFGLGAYALAMHLKLTATPDGELPDFMFYNGVEALPWWWKPFESPLFALLAVILIPALAAAAVGWLMFRRRITGVYFSLITQALVLAFTTLLIGSQGVTSGTNGITDFQSFLGIDLRAPAFGLQLYWATLLTLMGCYLLTRWLLGTHFGRLLIAIRDGENRVRFLGYDPATYKVAAFTLGAVLAGISGALYTLHLGTISPAMIGVQPSIEMVVWAALGGRASLGGAASGVILGNFLKDRISSAAPDAWLYLMGGAFILVVLLMPQGLSGVVRGLLRWRPASRRTPELTPEAASD